MGVGEGGFARRAAGKEEGGVGVRVGAASLRAVTRPCRPCRRSTQGTEQGREEGCAVGEEGRRSEAGSQGGGEGRGAAPWREGRDLAAAITEAGGPIRLRVWR